MLIKINDKWEAIHAVINKWLKDPTKYCNNCGKTYFPETGACCQNPAICTNWDVCLAIKEQNRWHRDRLANDFATTGKNKNMRWGVSIPPSLYQTLEGYMKQNGHKSVFKETADLNMFMKKFPIFTIAKKV